jgi:hypothetical protein
MGITNFPHGISSFGVPIYGGASQDNSGTTYFVDNNSGSDGNDGFSWESAFKTLARAIAISNIDIARGSDRWARRNTIYFAADYETAALVVFPNKCDVIGVGSYDANSKPGIYGHHVPVNSGNYGTRFFNIWFKSTAAATPIVTLASTSSGIQFHGCTFTTNGTTTIAVQSTASPFLKLYNNRIEGAFDTVAISILAGESGGTEIINNQILGAHEGIRIASTATTSWEGIIDSNKIHVAGPTVNDDSNLYIVTNNTLISDAAATTTTGWGSIIDINVLLAANNQLVGSDVNTVYPILDTTT